MHVSRKRAVAGLSLAVAATGFLAQMPASANPAGTGLVISEVYGARRQRCCQLHADYIELYNPTNGAVSLSGLSRPVPQRRTAARGDNSDPLRAVAANSHYLSKAPRMAPTAPRCRLRTQPQPPRSAWRAQPGRSCSSTAPQRFVGNGQRGRQRGPGRHGRLRSRGTTFETSPTGAAQARRLRPSSVCSGRRHGRQQRTTSARVATNPEGGGGVTPPPDEFTGTIAEIQGTGATSPHVDDIATTRGVVTAAYPTGGLNGFYIQTEGTGGATDDTPGASDAIFVFGSAATATVAIGDFVEVVGPVSEFAGTTEITGRSCGRHSAGGPARPGDPASHASRQ